MQTETTEKSSSLFTLFRALTGDTKTLIRQEIQLAKTEISEKLSLMGKNAVSVAMGGFVAYAGLIVFLIGLGWLIGYALSTAGVNPMLSGFIGIGGIGVVVLLVGVVLLMKGIKAFSKESLAPRRTIETLQELKGANPAPTPSFAKEHPKQDEPSKPSSAEIQDQVQNTEARLGANLEEIGYRLSPGHINAKVKSKIQAQPYRAGVIAVAAGFVSGFLLKRKFRHSAEPA
jgi:hypothetical protein